MLAASVALLESHRDISLYLFHGAAAQLVVAVVFGVCYGGRRLWKENKHELEL